MPPKKKKRVVLQNLGPVVSGPKPAAAFTAPTAKKKKKKKKKTTTTKKAMGYKRLENAAGGSVKEMKGAIREHNKRYCIKLSGSKKALNTRVKDTARKLNNISRSGGGGGGGGGGDRPLTEAEKKTQKAYDKIGQKYKTTVFGDANPELAF